MAVIIGSARIDERGRATGGRAGDQTGREVSTQNWYRHSKGWVVLRPKDAIAANAIAVCMERACRNAHVGYDQSQNQTLFNEAKKYGFDVSLVKKDVETDCARLVRVCCWYANIPAQDFYTGNMVSRLMATGAFTKLDSSKYTNSDAYLRRGDILVTRTKGHTVVALTNGSKAEEPVYEKPYGLGDRLLRNGSEGEDVKQLQNSLIELGYDLGRWGADGDFGDATEIAVRKFQHDTGCEVDGVVGKETVAKLDALLDAEPDDGMRVEIINGNCFIRDEPNTNGTKLDVAYRGAKYAYANEESETGWLKITLANGTLGWVSGKYARRVK